MKDAVLHGEPEREGNTVKLAVGITADIFRLDPCGCLMNKQGEAIT